MRKFLLTLIILLSIPSTAYAKESCKECHFEFSNNQVDRATVCKKCHYVAYHNTAIYNSNNGWFADASSYTTADLNFLHSKHNGNTSPNTTASCKRCHEQASCKVCHTNIQHDAHGAQSYTATFGWGASYGSITLSCATSNCHKAYSQLVFPSKTANTICYNCHADQHGLTRDAGNSVGVKTSANADPSKSDITISWDYQAGDSLSKSLDGITWSNINIGSPSAGMFSYTDTAVLNWTIIYYKITKADTTYQYFPVYPPGSNPHYNYLSDSSACASCHVTHSAEQAKLLQEKTVEDLCRTCHGLANTGSRYNVDTGEVVVAGNYENGLITAVSYVKSNSGAFGIESAGRYYAGNHASTWNGAEVTSTHSTNSLTSSIAPGGGSNGFNLTCISCHWAHPKKNSYRMLRIPNVEAFAVNTDGTQERVNYIRNMNKGCGCHELYVTKTNSGNTVDNGVYRHAVGVAIQGPNAALNITNEVPWNLTTTLPTERYDNNNNEVATLTGSSPDQSVTNGAVFCLTCHYAHGTTVTGTHLSRFDKDGNSVLDDQSTMLKRKQNMDVCEDCHKK